jgi:hypothetical protein
MPSDETRRLLKAFGIAITDYEDAVAAKGPRDKLAKIEAEVKARLAEVTALIERLGARKA